jgi:hypothetical protein
VVADVVWVRRRKTTTHAIDRLVTRVHDVRITILQFRGKGGHLTSQA